MQWFSKLPADVRARTPPEVVAAANATIAELKTRVAELERRLNQNSTNSSRPPSTDSPEVKHKRPRRARRAGTARKPGGQPGRQFADRPLLPPEQLKAIIPVKPPACHGCRRPLTGSDDDPDRHQVTDLPSLQAETTEFQLHTLTCPDCGLDTEAQLPDGVPTSQFGPRLQAMIGLAVGQYRMSKRQVKQFLLDGFGARISLGSIPNLEKATAEALKETVAEAQRHVQEQNAVYMDETGWREGNGTQKKWLWAVTTGLVTIFVIRASRGAKVIRELLGAAFGGIVHSDRWSAYKCLPVAQRQLCWAHLNREWLAFYERGGIARRLGKRLQELTDQMFAWWHRVRDGTLTPGGFRDKMYPVITEVGALLREGRTKADRATRGTCADILGVEDALWTFLYHDGLEPTNNQAERILRHLVIWRKANIGTQGESGSERLARLMSVVTTLRQQQRNVLEFLTSAITAHLRGQPGPSLLPASQSRTKVA